MHTIWHTDETKPQLLDLIVDGIHLGRWNKKWAKHIQARLDKLPSLDGVKEEILRFEEELGWREVLNMLARRACFSLEIRKKLESAGCSTPAIDSVIAKCIRLGYVDDQERAQRMVELWAKKGWGPLRIRLELKKQGVPLPRSLDHPSHEQFLVRFISKHLPKKATQKEKAKVIRSLLRRGFSLDAICKNLSTDL